MSSNAFARRPGRRSAALLSVAALAASGVIATAGSAGAAITAGAGGADEEGRPNFFRDGQGVALVLCTDEAQCEPVDPADPLHGGYFAAEVAAGPLTAIYGIETAAVEDDAGNPTGEAEVLNVARFRADGLRANARYTIQDPWGTVRVTADDRGRVDRVIESGGEAGTVRGGHVKTFLRRVNAPAGFLGALETQGRVVGSPRGFNQVTITGPGVNATGRSFLVNGQMRENTAMGTLDTNRLRLGDRTKARKSSARIGYSSFGTAPARVRVSLSGQRGAFDVVNNCTSVASGRECGIRVTYTPVANRNKTATLTIRDNTLAGPRTVRLRGIAPRR